MPIRKLTPEELEAQKAKLKSASDYILDEGKTAQEAITLVKATRTETNNSSPENPS